MALNISDPIVQEIISARVSLLFNFPFFGNLATRLKLVDATKWCKSMTTEGRHFFFNREWAKKLEKDELAFAVGHQVLHAVFDHVGRRGSRNKQIWDMAADYIVNYCLIKHEVGKPFGEYLYDKKYTDEMSVEEVYEDLLKNAVQIKVPMDEHMDLSGGGQSGEGDGDVEVYIINGDGSSDGPPKLSKEELDQIRSEIKAAVINAAHQSAGKLPAGIARMVADLTEPKLDWRTLLEMTIQSAIKDDFTFLRPSKKSWASKCILPGQNFANTIDVSIAIDASGSMTEPMLRDIVSEVKGIMDQFSDFKVRLWTFDTKIYAYQEYTPANIDDILSYPLLGGGGTSFRVNWEFMKNPTEHGIDVEEFAPQKFIMFTDMMTGDDYGDEQYTPDMLWVRLGNYQCDPKYGVLVDYQMGEVV